MLWTPCGSYLLRREDAGFGHWRLVNELWAIFSAVLPVWVPAISRVCWRLSGHREICSKELRRFVTLQHCFQVLAYKLAKPYLLTASPGSDSTPEFIKQQEGEKCARNAPLCPSEVATSKAVSLPLRAVPGLNLSKVKLPEQAALWKPIFLKLAHNTAAPLSHKSGPKRNVYSTDHGLRAHCLLVTLQPPTMLAKAQKLLTPAPCGEGSCLCMTLLVVPIPRAGTAKELTASSPQHCYHH